MTVSILIMLKLSESFIRIIPFAFVYRFATFHNKFSFTYVLTLCIIKSFFFFLRSIRIDTCSNMTNWILAHWHFSKSAQSISFPFNGSMHQEHRPISFFFKSCYLDSPTSLYLENKRGDKMLRVKSVHLFHWSPRWC